MAVKRGAGAHKGSEQFFLKPHSAPMNTSQSGTLKPINLDLSDLNAITKELTITLHIFCHIF